MTLANNIFSYPLPENIGDLQYDPDDDEDETLSFSDLPIYSNPSDWEETATIDKNLSSSSSSEDDQDFFEFSSKDFNFSASMYEAENIIFCGKIISYTEQKPVAPITHGSTKRGIFGWKYSSSLISSSCSKLKSPSSQKRDKTGKQLGNGVSALASPVKSRWYFYVFGPARFPVEMELRDMKTRQGRNSPTPMFQSQENKRQIVSRDRRGGFRGLLGVLGCKGSHHADTMVKSFTCITRKE